MKELICKKCGSDDLYTSEGYMICRYCDSRYVIEKGDLPAAVSHISLREDVKMLLQKCIDDPANARKYANLVLDLDPTNEEALKYL